MIVASPEARTVCEGAPVEFTVTASGTAPLEYQWRKDSVDLVDGPFVSGSQTDTLTLTDVTEEAGIRFSHVKLQIVYRIRQLRLGK